MPKIFELPATMKCSAVMQCNAASFHKATPPGALTGCYCLWISISDRAERFVDFEKILKRRPYTVYTTVSVACGWAGAVMWEAGAMGGAVYTTASVTCDWAGAVMRKLLEKRRKSSGVTDGPTDGPTDRRTDRRTDGPTE